MFSEYFRKLGIEERAEQVYLAVASAGKATAGLVSKRTKIPRATVYLLLNELSERGLISLEKAPAATRYVANDPLSFTRMVAEEREEIEGKELAAKKLIEQLVPFMHGTKRAMPHIQVFEGQKSINAMLYDFLPEWRNSLENVGDMTLLGYQDNTFIENYRKWHTHLWNTMTPKEKIRLFSNSSDSEKELSHKIRNREVRALPQGIRFSSSFWIYGEYIVMGMTHEKPHYAFMLKDSMMSANFRTIFTLLWKAKFD